ncbi:hypothetical protein GCM10020229_11420 [Kitasatospora albolonga]
MLTAAVVLGVTAGQLPALRPLVGGAAKAGLGLASKRLMRAGIVLLGLKLGLRDVLGLGWASVLMVLTVVAATFFGTVWLGRRLGLPGDQPLLIATGYSICGASAIGAVGQAAGSEEEDMATSAAPRHPLRHPGPSRCCRCCAPRSGWTRRSSAAGSAPGCMTSARWWPPRRPPGPRRCGRPSWSS